MQEHAFETKKMDFKNCFTGRNHVLFQKNCWIQLIGIVSGLVVLKIVFISSGLAKL